MADHQGRPIEEDIRFDDDEFNPAIRPGKSYAWLNLIEEAEDVFETWHDHCDRIDKQYASLERLANHARDREFQMFWANAEVIKPAIYAKSPVPAIVPKFKDRRPVYQEASEMLERCAQVVFDLTYINDLMLQIRDDIALIGRGVAWCRYESKQGKGHYDSERVCIDFKHRRDFLHSISRSWAEVTWVAAASYLTRSEARDRFYKFSGDCYQDAEYKVDKDSAEVGGADARERAKFWEIWDRTSRRVVWVAQGCEDILDEAEPHLDLSNYWPCPKPAYGTLQRGSLVPVPDVLQYKDQLDEINMLTGRIHALSDAIEAKGFYPAGSSEISDAVQQAIAVKTPSRVLVPISNWAAFGGTKEIIVWLPIDMIAQTVTQLVALRKEVINDIYQIMGLSDIMRGATDARETLGAQELKTQYGGTRIRDKQYELVRLARDLVCIVCEIVCEKFSDETIVEMSQTQLQTQQMQAQQLQQLQQQLMISQQKVQQAQANPQIQQMMQQSPDQAEQVQGQAQAGIQSIQSEINKVQAQPTIEQVLHLLHDNRTRAFVLDIETDSTIMADENAEKERRSEFLGMLAQLLPQLVQMIGAYPQAADFCGQVLKFSVAPFRAGRSLDGAIDELVDKVEQMGAQPKGDDPATLQNKTALKIEQMKNDRQAQKDKADVQLKAQELQMKDKHEQMKLQSQQQIEVLKVQQKQQDDAAKSQQTNQKAMHDRESHQMSLLKQQADLQFDRQKAEMAAQASSARQNDLRSRQDERRATTQFKQQQQGWP